MFLQIPVPGVVRSVFVSPAELAFVLILLPLTAFFGLCALYLWRLLLAAMAVRKRLYTVPPSEMTGGPVSPLPRFVLLIPAHNEELLLGAALDSLQQLDYPRDACTIVVIADNCTDQTARIAREHGAIALERFDTEKIGKGYALEWALHFLLNPADNSVSTAVLHAFDAVVILDADTQVSPNLLAAFARGLQAGEQVMQAHYDVLNVHESWRTRLMACALALAHVVKPLGRERLGLSDGLKGNGMCFSRAVVQSVPWSGESITEDIEYTLRLCRAGYRVAFLPEARVQAQMPATGAQAVSQRKRWEGGRYRLLFTVVPDLLREGLRRRSRILCDRAMELIIPPFAEMFAVPLALLAICLAVAGTCRWPWAWGLTWAWAVILALQAGYLIAGLWVARVPAQVAFSLLYAPAYIVWKLGVYLVMALTRSAGGWKRTERHQLSNNPSSRS
ncbi:MAG: glycosyltransferase family 2 protein [Chloroherpetonaceae bacterium]|nr:glycosyltransferase [Chthonomonadaceae bacterium]MDW8207462.1 glycosyltransferase family 2 protein [Chloroherpetonaceae bacterium]